MAVAFYETELSARKHAGDAFPDVGGADWVRYAVHMVSGLSDCSELGVLEGQTGPVRVASDDRAHDLPMSATGLRLVGLHDAVCVAPCHARRCLRCCVRRGTGGVSIDPGVGTGR